MTTIKLNLRDLLEEKCLDTTWTSVEVSLSDFLDYDDDWEHELDVHQLLAERQQIADIWGTEDVQSIRPDLTADQAWQVLLAVKRHHDAGIGIAWDVLEHHAESMYPEPEPKTFEVTVVARTAETYRVEAVTADVAGERWADGKLVRTDDTLEGEVLTVTEVQP
jgi:hypothetical protein